MEDKVKVSIYCAAYNQKDYIKSALDGFLKQRCGFSFEVLVHDDASSDGTAEIIRQYETKHSLIHGVYEKENIYSRGIPVLSKVLPLAAGEYIAFCEGDDFWTDSDKLARQVSFLDSHPEAGGCCHAFTAIAADNSMHLCEPLSDEGYIPTNLLIKNTNMPQTSTLVVRKSLLLAKPADFSLDYTGDYPLRIWISLNGGLYYLSQNMSSYRIKSAGSWSMKLGKSPEMLIQRLDKRIRFLSALKSYLQDCAELIDEQIAYAQYDFFLRTGDYKNAKKCSLYRSESIGKRIYITLGTVFPKTIFKLRNRIIR